MKLCQYRQAGSTPAWGIIEGDSVYAITTLPGRILPTPEALRRGEVIGALTDVPLSAPLRPGKIICVGRNYAAHAAERGEEVPSEPLLFFKPPSAVIGPGAAIQLLPEMGRVEHEAELVVIIGREGRFITEAAAMDYVYGYTCANDVSERDYQASDDQWARAKGFDTFCPVGPWIVTDFDPLGVSVMCHVNGVEKQHGHTGLMIYSIPFLISFTSRIMTLNPGDIILTGTPAGVSRLTAGDTVEVTVEGIGTLRNPVTLLEA